MSLRRLSKFIFAVAVAFTASPSLAKDAQFPDFTRQDAVMFLQPGWVLKSKVLTPDDVDALFEDVDGRIDRGDWKAHGGAKGLQIHVKPTTGSSSFLNRYYQAMTALGGALNMHLGHRLKIVEEPADLRLYLMGNGGLFPTHQDHILTPDQRSRYEPERVVAAENNGITATLVVDGLDVAQHVVLGTSGHGGNYEIWHPKPSGSGLQKTDIPLHHTDLLIYPGGTSADRALSLPHAVTKWGLGTAIDPSNPKKFIRTARGVLVAKWTRSGEQGPPLKTLHDVHRATTPRRTK